MYENFSLQRWYFLESTSTLIILNKSSVPMDVDYLKGPNVVENAAKLLRFIVIF